MTSALSIKTVVQSQDELIGYFTVYQCEQCEIHIGPPLNRADGGC